MTDIRAVQATNQRVWFIEGGVHPTRSPQFLALGKFSGDPKITLGDEKKISAPDPNNFNRDIQLGSMKGEQERATLSISVRTTNQASILMGWKNKGCRVDIFALSGKCGNPQDFTEGGEFWVYFPDGKLSNYAYENFGAFGLDENNPTNEAVDMTSEDFWQFLYMRQDVIGQVNTVRELYTVDTYAGDVCENCPNQYSKVLITMAGAAATPGTQPMLLYTEDAGETFLQQIISTLFSNEVVSDAKSIGSSFVLVSNTSNSIHWTDINELYEGSNSWNEVVNGFVIGKNPNAMAAPDVRHTWIVGNGGYVYFASNFKVGVMVQDPGVATTQHLQSVSALDAKNVMAVGNSNAVIFTNNGGSSWESVTGPAVGVNLGACWMWSEKVWFVGEGSGGTGKLWLTVNSGNTWTQIGLPNTYNRIYKVVFTSEAEGYILAAAGGQSYVLRTITAGNEWVVLPQGKKGTALSNTYLRDIAVGGKTDNIAYAVGLAANGTAGVALKMVG
jgi:photosystem II stability/assembly factor-like uncharacterized protein